MHCKDSAFEIGFAIGKNNAISDFNRRHRVEQIAAMKWAKQTRRATRTGPTWQYLCCEFGMSPANGNRLMRLYEEFGPSYFHLSHLVRISPANFRRIAHLVDGEMFLFDGDIIPIRSENVQRLRAAVRTTLDGLAGPVSEAPPQPSTQFPTLSPVTP